jgi:hypothetical protein
VTRMWDLIRRRPKLPADAGVTLERDERLLAWARAVSGGLVVATHRGLRLPGRAQRLGWHEIHKAVWSGRELAVTPSSVVEERPGYAVVADLPVETVLLIEPGDVPDQVRARVTGSVSFTAHHRLPGGGARVVARRVSGVDGLSWAVRYDPGTLRGPEVDAETDALVAQARAAADPAQGLA